MLHGDGIEIVSLSFMNQRRMPENAWIHPVSTSREHSKDISNPENILFDKAEQAEQREKAIQELQSRIAQLEIRKKDAAGDERLEIATLIEQQRMQLAELENHENKEAVQITTASAQPPGKT